MDVTNLVRYSLKVADPDVARLQDGVVLQGRAVGTTTVQVSHEVYICIVLAASCVKDVHVYGSAVWMRLYLLQVLSPLTSSVLGERSIRVVDDKVSVTELGVQLVSGLSLSLQLSPGSNRAVIAMATTRETITQLKQVSHWKIVPHKP